MYICTLFTPHVRVGSRDFGIAKEMQGYLYRLWYESNLWGRTKAGDSRMVRFLQKGISKRADQ